ncbi:MAG: NAD(P)-binding domain-containing protein [Candidatus Marinimicrobia bacterium]|nr:NAD(P)-binding domain-containing protein [Candidatus Neomarinimicrobiota bacterium]
MDILALNETLVTYLFGTSIIAIVLGVYFFMKFRQARRTISLISEADKTGKRNPLLLHPQFDLAACIGCGVCTKVCPEGDVLGLVNGKVAIVHGARCIGIGECARECPVGAIIIGLGDISTRDDIPQLSENLESNIPGLFVIGELTGMALIKNALAHGTSVIDHIHATGSENAHVVIIGAGPAGMTAALRCIEKKIDHTLVDQGAPGGTILHYPKRKLTLVQPVKLPLYGTLNKGEYTKEKLLEMWLHLITKYKINLKEPYRLTAIDKTETGFIVKTDKSDIPCTHVLLALGRRGTPRKLNVPGEMMEKVAYKLIDASTYNDNNLLIVGGGDSAIEAAVGLAAQHGNKVTISYRKENFFRIKKRNEDQINDMIKRKKIDAIFSSQVTEIHEDKVILKKGEDVIELPNDYVFVFAGGIPPFSLLHEIGIRFGEVVESKVDVN